MTWFIFIGDLLVMAGLIAVAVWLFLRANPADLNAAARIPLEDENLPRPQAEDENLPRPQAVKRAHNPTARSAVIPAGKQETRRHGWQSDRPVDVAFESPAAPSADKTHA